MVNMHPLGLNLKDIRIGMSKNLRLLSDGFLDGELGETSVERDEEGRIFKIIAPTVTETVIEWTDDGKMKTILEEYTNYTLKRTIHRDEDGRWLSESLTDAEEE